MKKDGGAAPVRAAREQSLSLKKAIRILRCFSHEQPEWNLTDLMQAAGLPRTVCYRLLTTLEDESLIERNRETGRYQLTLTLFTIGSVVLSRTNLRSAASHELQDLSRETSDTVCLVIEHGGLGVCIDRVDGDFPLQQSAMTVGKALPLHAGGAPFALLAYQSDDRIEEILSSPLAKLTAKTVIDPVHLRERIAEVRERGYAVGDEDTVDYLVAIGIPLFSFGGRLAGAFSIGGLKQRYPPRRIMEVAERARRTGMRISERLGCATVSSAERVASLSSMQGSRV